MTGGGGFGNHLVVKVLPDHVTTDIEMASRLNGALSICVLSSTLHPPILNKCTMFGHRIPICLNEIHCVLLDNYVCVCVCVRWGNTGGWAASYRQRFKETCAVFSGNKDGHECPSEAVSVCMSVLSAPAFITMSRTCVPEVCPIKLFN